MKSIPDPDTTPAEKTRAFKDGLRQILTVSESELAIREKQYQDGPATLAGGEFLPACKFTPTYLWNADREITGGAPLLALFEKGPWADECNFLDHKSSLLEIH